MSIMKIAKIKDSNSKEYRKLVSGIYSQFENLYKTMDLYAITESLAHIRQAYKCFEKTVDRELRSRQR